MTAIRIAAIDCETTGLSPAVHEVWEFAAILAEHDTGRIVISDTVHFDIPVSLKTADSTALRIGGYYSRREQGMLRRTDRTSISRPPPHAAAERIALALADRHIVAANPTFDVTFLDRLLRRHDQAGAWHHRLIDVEALAAGHLHQPIRSLSDTCTALGIDRDPDLKHTALGDADAALRVYATVYQTAVVEEGVVADVA